MATAEAVAPVHAAMRARMRPAAWWMLAVLLLFYTLSLLDRGSFNMLVVPIQKHFGLSDTQMSVLMGPAFAISYSLFGIPLGWASDRFARRWILFFSLAVWSLAAGSTGLAGSFATLLMARIFVGIGEAALSPCSYSLIADAFPQRRLTLAMSVYQTGSKLGAGLSFSMVALAAAAAAAWHGRDWPLVGQLQPWQVVFLLTGAPGIFAGLLLLAFREPQGRPRALDVAGDASGFVPYLRANARLVGLMLLAVSMCSIGVLAMGSWVPAFLERRHGLTPQQYGPILSLISFAGAGSLVFKGLIVDWLSLVAFLSHALLPFWIAYGIVDMIVGQFVFYFAATVQLVTPTDLRGRNMALFQAAFSLVGTGLGPMIVALVTDHVFHDPQRLGDSLALVTPGAFVVSLLCLRAVLSDVRRVVTLPDQSVESSPNTV
jgi:MFS family permease